ncbi:hypothetical protein UJ101_01892 [Flavobacteriaceae bacterium UJ101]|nr:hypothetical protein UJ101_01892 [Flavobacteriaceae bacterium UJ101]
MKKILLSVSVLGAVVASAQSGISVAAGGSVHVQPNTLVYSQGGLDVATTGTVVSDGHVQLETKYTNAKADGSNVQFMYTDTTSGNAAGENTAYGQLIIKDNASSVTGKVFMETPIIKKQSGVGVEISFPFKAGGSLLDVVNSASSASYNASTGVTTLTSLGNSIADAGSYNTRPIYYQKNNTHEVEPEGATLRSPETLYSIFMTQAGYSTAFTNISTSGNASDQIDVVFSGIPYTGAFDVSQVAQVLGSDGTTTFESVSDLATSKARKNSRGHYYYTYLEDFVDAATASTWGHNIYGYGNPYTSNISLTQLFADSNIDAADIAGLAIHGSEADDDFEGGAGSTSGKFYRATCSGSDGDAVDSNKCAGDLVRGTNFILRPFGSVWVKYRTGKSVHTLKFSDNIKTFGYTGLILSQGTLVGNASGDNTSARVANSESSSARRASARTASASNVNSLEVLRLGINQNDKQLDNVFIAANPWAEKELDDKLDAHKEATEMLTVVNEDLTSEDKNLHINGISMDEYVGKPINLAVNTNAGSQYSFKGDVRIASTTNLDNTNFFFEDKQAKKIVRVGSDFDYSYIASNNDDNRFTVYYKETPVDVDEEVVDEVTGGEMNVAKDASGETYVVFKGMTGKAKVMVYNVLGQLVYADEDVSTNANYSLSKLPENSGVYIVKVIDDKGKVISKKIVK